jgi:hypothetical protein
MVVRAIDKDTRAAFAIKIYIKREFFNFLREMDINKGLINHPNVVIATKCVPFSDVGAPLVIKGVTFYDYSYIVVPYH